MLSTLMPLAARGGQGVDIQVLIDFIPYSRISMLAVLLYPLGVVFVLLSVLDLMGKTRDAALWYMLICGSGLIVTGISIVEAISHIALFGAICSSVPGLSSATGPTMPAIGGYLLLVAYLGGIYIGLISNSANHSSLNQEC